MAFLLALLSAAIYGVSDFLGGLATRRAAVLTVTFASQLVGFLGLGIMVALSGVRDPTQPDLAWGAAAGLAGGTGVALLYYGLATGVASVVAPVTGVCSIAVPVTVGLLLGERPSWLALLGIGIAVAAVVLLSRGEADTTTPVPQRSEGPGRISLRRSISIALASGVAVGAFLTCLGRTRPESGLWPLIAARVVSVSGFALLCLAARSPFVPAAGARARTMGAGFLDVGANALYVMAVQRGPLGLVASLASLYPATTVALAQRVLGERLGASQKVGFGLALLAILLITLPSR